VIAISDLNGGITIQEHEQINHPLELWKDKPCTCIHCGKVLKNYYAKNSHLGHCKKRILNRYIKIDRYLFILKWNPLKRRALAIEKMIKDFQDKDTLPKLVVGACEYLRNAGVLKDYSITEVESDEFVAYPDGWVSYPRIKKLMKPQELQIFESNAQELSNRNANKE
jgi:hypothetical protein